MHVMFMDINICLTRGLVEFKMQKPSYRQQRCLLRVGMAQGLAAATSADEVLEA